MINAVAEQKSVRAVAHAALIVAGPSVTPGCSLFDLMKAPTVDDGWSDVNKSRCLPYLAAVGLT